MKPSSPLFSAGIAAALFFSPRSDAAMLLVDPSTGTPAASNTFPSGPSQPYPVATTDIWNSGTNSTYGALGAIRYADGSAATGVSIITDSLGAVSGNPASGEYNFAASPSVSTAGNAGIGGVFSSNPVNNSVFGNVVGAVGGLNYGGVAMKITGLASGTYDIYLVAAYTGTTTNNLPGRVNAGQQNVWAFSRPTGTTVLTTGTYGAANDLLENSTTASWTAGNNYSKISVTIDAANPDLYIVSEGLAGTVENRGWISSIEIVPEPSSALLGMLGALSFLAIRRRK